MNTIKLFLMCITLNLLIGMAAIAASGTTAEKLDAFFAQENARTAARVASIETTSANGGEGGFLASTTGSFLNIIDGIVNMGGMAFFFIKLFFEAMLAIPNTLFSAASSYVEKMVALAIGITYITVNLAVIIEGWSIVVGKKPLW